MTSPCSSLFSVFSWSLSLRVVANFCVTALNWSFTSVNSFDTALDSLFDYCAVEVKDVWKLLCTFELKVLFVSSFYPLIFCWLKLLLDCYCLESCEDKLFVSLFSPLLPLRGTGDTPEGEPVPSELGLNRLLVLVLLFLQTNIGQIRWFAFLTYINILKSFKLQFVNRYLHFVRELL